MQPGATGPDASAQPGRQADLPQQMVPGCRNIAPGAHESVSMHARPVQSRKLRTCAALPPPPAAPSLDPPRCPPPPHLHRLMSSRLLCRSLQSGTTPRHLPRLRTSRPRRPPPPRRPSPVGADPTRLLYAAACKESAVVHGWDGKALGVHSRRVLPSTAYLVYCQQALTSPSGWHTQSLQVLLQTRTQVS